MRWSQYLVLLSAIILFQCQPKLTEYFVSPSMMQDLATEADGVNNLCNTYESYIPDTTLAHADNLRRIRMNIHFMNTSDWSNNYNGEEAINYAKEMVRYANEKLYHNRQMNLPEGNNTEVYYPGYRYDLEEDGIYFHADDELAFYVNEGRRNNYKRDVINKYAVGEDSILNVFYMIHHPDSVRSKTYSASSSGIALGKSLKMGVKYNPDDPPYRHSALLNHEVGHVLGLSHTWNLNDGCDDTPKNRNCWVSTETGRCKGVTSNNLMDYNSNQNALTPCQIGKMRKNMATLGTRQRDLLKRNWCTLNPRRNVEVTGNTHFKGAKDLLGSITVRNGGTLKISCRLSMPAGSEIRVEPGGQLILENARLHNDCGLEWKGIIAMKEGKEIGRVFKMGEVAIENVKGLPLVDE